MRLKMFLGCVFALSVGLGFCKDENAAHYTPEIVAQLAHTAAEKPSDAGALNDYAWGLLIAPSKDLRDARRALSLAQKAAETSEFKNPDILDSLALAHFNADAQADDAVKFQQMACDLLPANMQLYLQKPLRSRLAFYSAWAHLQTLKKSEPDKSKDELAKTSNAIAWMLLTEKGIFFGESEDAKCDRALELSKAAVASTDPPSPYYRDTLALATFKKGDAAEAVRVQESAIAGLPANPDNENAALRKEKLSMECTLELYKLSIAAAKGRTWESFPVLRGDGPGAKIPMILVHGDHGDDAEFGRDCRWTPLVEKLGLSPLIRKNFDVFIWKHNTAEPVGFNGSTGNAKELAEYINSTFQDKPVLLVAHSRGGLVCRAYMNYRNQGDRVLGLITLGTPHHGTPGAVPDLVGISCSFRSLESARAVGEFLGADWLDAWQQLFNKGGAGLAVERPGSVNLAWDNLDGFLTNDALPYDRYYLCQSDFNDVISCDTSYYPASLKSLCGTLADLNRRERYTKKIIAYGAYGKKMETTSSTVAAVKATYERWAGGKSKDQLKFASNLLSRLHENIAPVKPNYVANDGLVPLQSALFLDIADGKVFAEVAKKGTIVLNKELIEQSSQVQTIRVIDGANHRTFVDDPERYWDLFKGDVAWILFKANPSAVVTPDLSAQTVGTPQYGIGVFTILNDTGRALTYESRWKKSDDTWTPWTSAEAPKSRRVTEWLHQGAACELRVKQRDGTTEVFPLSVNRIAETETAKAPAAKHYKITGSRKSPYAVVEE